MADLILSEGSHLHSADNVLLNGLLVSATDHSHVVDGVVLTLTLPLAEGNHLLVDDECWVSLHWKMTTLADDGKTYPRLPALEIDARTGERIELDEWLPAITLGAMRAGARMSIEPKLPDLELSASGTAGFIAALDKRLPTMTLTARFGNRTSELLLPAMELDISITGDRLGWLSKSLPGLTIISSGSTPVLATLTKDLPSLELTASAYRVGTGALDKTLPPLLLAASALAGASGTLAATLPAMKVETGMYGDQLSLNAILPTLVINPVGTGGSDGQPAELVNADRFADYVLRYER